MAEAEDVAPWREIHADRSRWLVEVEQLPWKNLYAKHFETPLVKS